MLLIGPVLNGAALQDFHQLGVEHIVGQGNLVAGEGGHSGLLSTQDALDHQLYGVLLVDLRLNSNLAGSVEGNLVSTCDLGGNHSHIDSRNLVTLFDRHV